MLIIYVCEMYFIYLFLLPIYSHIINVTVIGTTTVYTIYDFNSINNSSNNKIEIILNRILLNFCKQICVCVVYFIYNAIFRK